MDLAEPLPPFVPDSALFFSLPVDSVRDPVPFQGMIFPIKLTTVGFCCLQPKLSLIQLEWGIWAGWRPRKQVPCSEASGSSGEAVWSQKPTEGFPGGVVVENLPANAGDTGSSPGLGRSHMPWSN